MFKRFLQRRFSLMLALRYLNPLRTYFSVITLICLVGVALGIAVLILSLSVMGGLQRDIKERFLAYTPHITVSHLQEGYSRPMDDWRTVVESLKKTPGVVTAYPQIEDYVLVDTLVGAQKPASFRAVDTENDEQMEDLKKLVEEGDADMGMGEEAIISKSMADNMRIHVGDTIRVYAKRNYDPVIQAFKQRSYNFKKDQAESLDFVSQLWKQPSVSGSKEYLTLTKVEEVGNVLLKWQSLPYLRETERKTIQDILALLEIGKKEGKESLAYPLKTGEKYASFINILKTLDTEKEDLASFDKMEDIVLPRELTVVGTYLSSKHISSPEIFVPLNVGQELLGYEDPVHGGYWDAVQVVAVRVKDPYAMEGAEDAVLAHLPDPGENSFWSVTDWMRNPAMSSWVNIMQQERVMISFVLFFIMLISSFCIMAVMFAMGIQRKKEIAVMRALGATPVQVVKVFLWQGLIIGLAGALMGIGLGLLVLYKRMPIWRFLKSFGFDPFPAKGFHGVNEIPCLINVNEIMMIAVTSFILVVIAAIIPAILVSRQDPAKSLRSL